MEKLHFDNGFVQIYYLDDIKSGIGRWKGFISGNDYRNALNSAADLFKEKKIYKWIANLSEMETITDEDQKWANEDWFPRALQAGLKRLAIIVGTDVFNQMSVEQIMSNVASMDLKTQYFDSEEKAKAWMATQ
ncbi:MAG: STAS/SEC14 domain-containing protein [Cytophagales bacterium]|nr:STAS/SEC14 domain-containing protein [Cytophagales bacterium]